MGRNGRQVRLLGDAEGLIRSGVCGCVFSGDRVEVYAFRPHVQLGSSGLRGFEALLERCGWLRKVVGSHDREFRESTVMYFYTFTRCVIIYAFPDVAT